MPRALAMSASCFLGIAYLHTPNAEEGTLSRGLCHFLTDAAQPSFESNRVGRCLDIENCRDLLQIGERTFDALSRFRTRKAISQGLMKGGPSFRRFNVSDDCLSEFVGTASSFAVAIAELLAAASFSVPHSPLGSAVDTAIPTSMGLCKTLVHSSGVKLCLFAMAVLIRL